MQNIQETHIRSLHSIANDEDFRDVSVWTIKSKDLAKNYCWIAETFYPYEYEAREDSDMIGVYALLETAIAAIQDSIEQGDWSGAAGFSVIETEIL